MDKIEKIRQEIERRKSLLTQHRRLAYSLILETFIKEYDDLLSFLDTLSEEPDKSLEEEVKNYFQGHWPGTETAEKCNTDLHFTPLAILRLASHFAEWQKEKDTRDMYMSDTRHFQKVYELGKKDMKEQMKKEAVEGYVNYYEDSGGILMAEAQVGCPYHNGDKVKLIIIKDDGKSD